MTIRQCAGLEPTHQDIRLCGWDEIIEECDPSPPPTITAEMLLAVLIKRSGGSITIAVEEIEDINGSDVLISFDGIFNNTVTIEI